MGVLMTHGMGDGEPVRECEGCGADVQGRPVHLVNWDGDRGWVCDECRKQRPIQVIA